MPTSVRYFKVIGACALQDGRVRHFLREVGDFTGASFTGILEDEETHVAAPENEQPRGTIIKITETRNRVVELNPTS